MSEPQDHSPSGFDATPPDPGAPSGADRFWRQYSSARTGRNGGRNGEDAANVGAGSERGQGADHDHECLEWCPICRSAEVVRATTPPELRGQFQTLQRDALVMMRSLIDAYLMRIGEAERAAAREQPVEDIPIE